MNSSFFENSTSPIIKYGKEVQTNPEHEIAMQIDVPAQDDVLGFQSHVLSRMDDCTSSSDNDSEIDNTANERVQDNLAEDFVSESSNSEEKSSDSEADCGAEDDLIEQENRNCILSNENPASERIKIVVFEAAIVNAFTNCLQCGAPCAISLKTTNWVRLQHSYILFIYNIP